MRLTLLVPELIWPEPGDQHTLGNLSLPGWEWLTARANLLRRPATSFESALTGQFGLNTSSLGALRLLGEDLGDAAIDGHWLCADPVHLRFHHERIVLADAGAFALDDDEARDIAAAINDEFADIGQLEVASARRWYLRLNPEGASFAGACAYVAAPLSVVAGRRVDSELGEHDGTLRRWLNEVQMFLHGHPLNTRREEAGKPAVNSLWLWGGGRLQRPQPGHFTAVWSDNPLATGLARAAGTPAHPLPEGLAGLLRLASPGTAPLVVLDSLLPPVLYEDSDGWRRVWQALDADWLAPLRQALGQPVRELNIVAPTIYGELHWSLRAIDRWKFWRRGQPLAALAQQLAEGQP